MKLIKRLFRKLFKKKNLLEIQFILDAKTKGVYYRTIKERLGEKQAKKLNELVNKHLRELEPHFNKKEEGWDISYELLKEQILHEFMGNFGDFLINKIVLKKRKIVFVSSKSNKIMIRK